MAQPFVGQLMLVGFSFQAQGWAYCQGQTLAISQNETLFNLIGTTYGGDGMQTFNLPDLRGRVPVHAGFSPFDGQTYVIGQVGGVETVTLTAQQMPQHTHAVPCSANPAGSSDPTNGVFAAAADKRYSTLPPATPMAPNVVTAAGGSQPHSNLQPYLVLNWLISLFGIFPSQN